MEQQLTYRPGDWVVYKNNQLIAFNKPPALPVQADKTGHVCLLDLAQSYCQHPLLLIHRLDRPASGVVLFAKKTRALVQLNEQFQQRRVAKRYLAVVAQLPEPPEGELRHWLKRDGRLNKSFVVPEGTKGAKEAVLYYRHVCSSDRYHLLDIELITGRHHQIRAQLAAIGAPVKGDVKYGFRRGNRDRSIHLHAYQLAFDHPVTGEWQMVRAPVPSDPLWQFFAERLNEGM